MTRPQLDLEAIRQRVDEVKAYANSTPHPFALSASIYMMEDLLEETERLRDGMVTALVSHIHADTCGAYLSPGAGYPCSCWQSDLRDALGDPS